MKDRRPTFADLRREAKLTQAGLGELIAEPGSDTTYHQPRIFAYEHGRKKIPAAAAAKIAAVLTKRLGREITEGDLIHEKHRGNH